MYAFVGGIPEWHQFNYPMTENKKWQEIPVEKLSPKQLINTVKDPAIYVLDVRPLDFSNETAFIRNSFHCPLVYLADRYIEIPKDHNIVITDWAMKQSPSAAKFLIEKGYKVVGVLRGGIERWKSENLPVEERAVTSALSSLGAR